MTAKARIDLARQPAPQGDYERLERATEGIEAPFALVDLDAMWCERATTCCAAPPASRSGSPPSRSAAARCWSASWRASPATAGCSPTRCPRRCGSREQGFDDLVVGYPTADRTAIAELAS